MSENLGIELYNELPKFFFGNEKYLLVQGFVKALDSFEKCNLYINNKLVAVSKPSVRYSKVKLKICANLFQFMVELPSLKNEKEVIIELKVIAKNEEQLFQLASIPVKKISQKIETEKVEMVAVCMPLYQPNIKLFKQQLQSILQQSYQKIKIIIQDDCSTRSIFNEVKEYIKAFDNVYLFRNDENIGFYKNVELLLNKVGHSFDYVALSDQDDVWELDKIEKQVEFLNGKQADLCYTDLKIVDENYKVLQHSYWLDKSNHLKNAFALNLRNVATGSTMLFKQSVLQSLLPFPQKISMAHHDHYICTQLQNTNTHKVIYLNEPLINYVQHNNNVTGFSKTKTVSFLTKIIKDFALLKLLLALLYKKNIAPYVPAIEESKRYYYNNYQRLKFFLVHQQKLKSYNFFNYSLDIKHALCTFYLSYQSYISKLNVNNFDEVIYKSIFTQLALKLRYLLRKK